jgi:hypothetical protein
MLPSFAACLPLRASAEHTAQSRHLRTRTKPRARRTPPASSTHHQVRYRNINRFPFRHGASAFTSSSCLRNLSIYFSTHRFRILPFTALPSGCPFGRIYLSPPPTGLDANPIRRSNYRSVSCPCSHPVSARGLDRQCRSSPIRVLRAAPCGANDLWWFRTSWSCPSTFWATDSAMHSTPRPIVSDRS